MLRVGLTGAIGAGKSAVSARLATLGAVIVDADQLAREVVAPGTEGLAEIVAVFGRGVLGSDGGLDRPAMAAAVFGDEAARRRLEAIIHPRVRARTAELFAAAPADAIVVNDVPLLAEVGLAPSFHLVVVVEAPVATRVARLAGRGMPEAEARARIAAQTSDDVRRMVADVVLDNSGDLADLYAAVDTLWRDRLVPYEQNFRKQVRVRRPDHLHLTPYDPTWPAQYARLAARLAHAGGDLVRRVDHIGSTAVPGMLAKDVIDILVTIPADATRSDAALLAAAFTDAGFPPADPPGNDDGTVRLLHGGADPGRLVHVHVRQEGTPAWRAPLLLRDWLRANPPAAAEYAALKRDLATPLTSDYAKAKKPWLTAAQPRAEAWATQTAWTP